MTIIDSIETDGEEGEYCQGCETAHPGTCDISEYLAQGLPAGAQAYPIGVGGYWTVEDDNGNVLVWEATAAQVRALGLELR